MFLSKKKETPYLLLAPMEGVGDIAFRKSLAKIGGFDEVVREFISVPCNAHVESLAKVYDKDELSPTILVPQIMGSDPNLMAEMAKELAKRGALRIDINCGCPSNTVTGRGAGSSLLKEPNSLYLIAKAVVSSSPVPVSLKMRSGYEDTSLFKENLQAAEESGVCLITLHPRTKAEGYQSKANWDLIAQAKTIVKTPIVGNGDIVSAEDALFVLSYTKCDALMIGRGAVRDPFLFHKIRAKSQGKHIVFNNLDLVDHLEYYSSVLPRELSNKGKIGKLKQMFVFLCQNDPFLAEQKRSVLSSQIECPLLFLKKITSLILLKDFLQDQLLVESNI